MGIRSLADVGITPNSDGLPGIAEAKHIVGALLTYALIAAVAGLAISAIVWALGSHSSNPHMVTRGRSGVLVAGAVALLVGAADSYITFFLHVGASI